MTFKSLLVHLDASPACARRTALAMQLAQDFDAHLAGVGVVQPLVIPGSNHPEAVVRLLQEQWERSRQEARRLVSGFAEGARQAGIALVDGRLDEGEPEDVVSVHARYADLVILGQPDAGRLVGGTRLLEMVVLNAGRPTLIVPQSAPELRIAGTVLVAWNASREAARAVSDAIPLLVRAARVEIVTVNARPDPRGHGDNPGADIATFLARHGVKAGVSQTHATSVDIGEWLLSRAADLDAGMIVMGAYGHSRLREMVLGGATRTVLQSMTVPVLMSH